MLSMDATTDSATQWYSLKDPATDYATDFAGDSATEFTDLNSPPKPP